MERSTTHSEREWILVGMELIVEEGWRRLDRVRSPGKPWAALLRDGVTALLDLLAERPALAHLALIEAPDAGARAGTLHASAKAALLDFAEQGREQGQAGVPASAARGAFAGAELLIAGRILAGQAATLGELAPDVVYMLAVPFLGRAEAGRLAAAPAKRGHLRAVA